MQQVHSTQSEISSRQSRGQALVHSSTKLSRVRVRVIALSTLVEEALTYILCEYVLSRQVLYLDTWHLLHLPTQYVSKCFFEQSRQCDNSSCRSKKRLIVPPVYYTIHYVSTTYYCNCAMYLVEVHTSSTILQTH